MTGLPIGLSPTELMTLRFQAQSADDFAAIYHSSHRLSTLRRSFPRLNEYLVFAAQSLSGQIVISSYELLAEKVTSKKAFILCSVKLAVQGEPESFVEVAELRYSAAGWRFLHCARLPTSVLPDDPSTLDLEQFSLHPEAVVY